MLRNAILHLKSDAIISNPSRTPSPDFLVVIILANFFRFSVELDTAMLFLIA